MHWVIQSNVFNEPFFFKMLDLLERMNIPHDVVRAVPFTGEMIPEPVIDGPAIAIGSYSFTNRARQLGWRPGSWTNENYDYRVWSRHWDEFVLNKGEVCQFGSVPEREGLFFMRPTADDKAFTGHVLDYSEYSAWRQKLVDLVEDTTTVGLSLDAPVLVAEPVGIAEEYRFVVIDGEPITGSLYKSRGVALQREVRTERQDLYDYVARVISTWQPARVFCLDVAISGGQPYVLEMGNFNSAGLYQCDVHKIVESIEGMLVE